MDIYLLQEKARRIWGDEPQTLESISLCLTVIVGDIAREARAKSEDQPYRLEDVQKELGNLILSVLRWMDDLGLDPNICITSALIAQERYTKRLNS